MSNKERIIELLDSVPDYKIGYVLAYVQGIVAGEEPDEWDKDMIKDSKENGQINKPIVGDGAHDVPHFK